MGGLSQFKRPVNYLKSKAVMRLIVLGAIAFPITQVTTMSDFEDEYVQLLLTRITPFFLVTFWMFGLSDSVSAYWGLFD